MTTTDDELAKHIKEMILRITRRSTNNQEPPRKPDTLKRIARTLGREPDYPLDLLPPAPLL
jgi:hypothetical protein